MKNKCVKLLLFLCSLFFSSAAKQEFLKKDAGYYQLVDVVVRVLSGRLG